MRIQIAAAALALASSSQAATGPDHYALRTAGDLARVCAAAAADTDASTASALCHGFLAGAYGYFLAVTPAADRFVCPPDPAPSRSKVGTDFAAWLKARPQLAGGNAVDVLFRFAAEAYPCKR